MMKPASLPELKKELKHLDHEEIIKVCLRLGRFKKDNKELLTYLLFDARDEQGYIENIKFEIDSQMEDLNKNNLYYAKKGLQKINRQLTKYIRYSGNKQTEVEVLIHFATAIKGSGIVVHRSTMISKLYDRLVVKINKALSTLHEDIRADYREGIRKLKNI